MERIKETAKEFFKLLIYPIFFYLEIDIPIIAGLGALMIFDTISGSIKAIRLGYEFKTQSLVWGLIIKWMILGIPFTVALVGKITGYDISFIVETTLKIITVSEAISIIANIYSAKTRKEVKRIDAISMIFHIVRKSLFSSIQNAIKKIEDSADCNFRDDK